MIKWVAVSLALLGCYFAENSSLAARNSANSTSAVIERFECRACIKVRRAGKTLKLNIGLNLFEGDELEVSSDGGEVIYRVLGLGDAVTLTFGDPVVTIPAPTGDRSSPLYAVLSGIISKLVTNRWFVRRNSQAIPYLAPDSEEGSLEILVDNQPRQLMLAGTRDIDLAWRGGVAPFSVEVFRTGQIVRALQTDNRFIHLPSILLTSSTEVRILVRDDLGRDNEIAIETIASSALDNYKPAWSEDLDDPADRMLVLSQIAVCSDGRALLEVVNQLFESGKTYLPALLLGEGLLLGQMRSLKCLVEN